MQGKPDIVLPRYRAIVDVRGCFWHGQENCKYGDQIKSSSLHFQKRIKDAKLRDIRNIEVWKNLGWRVFIIWDRTKLKK